VFTSVCTPLFSSTLSRHSALLGFRICWTCPCFLLTSQLRGTSFHLTIFLSCFVLGLGVLVSLAISVPECLMSVVPAVQWTGNTSSIVNSSCLSSPRPSHKCFKSLCYNQRIPPRPFCCVLCLVLPCLNGTT
jgi:hypothetical protein